MKASSTAAFALFAFLRFSACLPSPQTISSRTVEATSNYASSVSTSPLASTASHPSTSNLLIKTSTFSSSSDAASAPTNALPLPTLASSTSTQPLSLPAPATSFPAQTTSSQPPLSSPIYSSTDYNNDPIPIIIITDDDPQSSATSAATADSAAAAETQLPSGSTPPAFKRPPSINITATSAFASPAVQTVAAGSGGSTTTSTDTNVSATSSWKPIYAVWIGGACLILLIPVAYCCYHRFEQRALFLRQSSDLASRKPEDSGATAIQPSHPDGTAVVLPGVLEEGLSRPQPNDEIHRLEEMTDRLDNLLNGIDELPPPSPATRPRSTSPVRTATLTLPQRGLSRSRSRNQNQRSASASPSRSRSSPGNRHRRETSDSLARAARREEMQLALQGIGLFSTPR